MIEFYEQWFDLHAVREIKIAVTKRLRNVDRFESRV